MAARVILAAFFVPEGIPTLQMSDPFMGWLSNVDQLLALLASIFTHLAKIFGCVSIMLSTVLAMLLHIRKFRRDLATTSDRCKPTESRFKGKYGAKRSSTST